MGSLIFKLEISAVVIYQQCCTYHWLQMVSAGILLTSNLIRLRLGRDVRKDVPIQADTGTPRINVLFREFEDAGSFWLL